MEEPEDGSKGLHIVLDMLDCKCPRFRLEDGEIGLQYVLSLIKGVGLHVVDVAFRQFEGLHGEPTGGWTALIGLSESHCSVHTWPGENKVNADVFCCSVTRDNSEAARQVAKSIEKYFEPKESLYQEIKRK